MSWKLRFWMHFANGNIDRHFKVNCYRVNAFEFPIFIVTVFSSEIRHTERISSHFPSVCLTQRKPESLCVFPGVFPLSRIFRRLIEISIKLKSMALIWNFWQSKRTYQNSININSNVNANQYVIFMFLPLCCLWIERLSDKSYETWIFFQ